MYNDSVNNYNIRIQSIPDTLVARALSLKEEEMFKVDKNKIKDLSIDLDNLSE